MSVRVRQRLFIYGRVQGVGFRVFLRQQAKRYQVNGWVKNRSDGSVEALLEGTKNAVEELTKIARMGPRWARVEKVEVLKEDYLGDLGDFMIK